MTKSLWPRKEEWVASPARYTKNSLIVAGHSVMERWETPYMKMLAAIATSNGGDILEVGFGLGISASWIQSNKSVTSHTIIEFHPDVIKKCKTTYSKKIKKEQVMLLEGLWEDIAPQLPAERFDGILFDTYPLSSCQNKKMYFSFFKEMHRLLRKNGVFTYYSDEPRAFSKEHHHHLQNAGFTDISFKVCKVNPPKGCTYWTSKAIIAPVIRK